MDKSKKEDKQKDIDELEYQIIIDEMDDISNTNWQTNLFNQQQTIQDSDLDNFYPENMFIQTMN